MPESAVCDRGIASGCESPSGILVVFAAAVFCDVLSSRERRLEANWFVKSCGIGQLI